MDIKIGGKWRKGLGWVRVGGKWRKGVASWIKVNGVWKRMAYAITKVVITQQIQDTSYGSTRRYGTINIEEFTIDPAEYPLKGLNLFTLQEDNAPSPNDAWVDIWVSDTEQSWRLYNALVYNKANLNLENQDTSSSLLLKYDNATFRRYSATGNIRVTPKDKSSFFYFMRRNRGRTVTVILNIND